MHSDPPDRWQTSTPDQAAPGLRDGVVHQWLLSLDDPPLSEPTLAGWLDDDELARAARFHFEVHRRRFVAAHGLLRWILAAYAGSDPGDLRYRRAPHGKPTLAHPALAPALEFSLSHSAGWALVGVTQGAPLGVDIEVMRDVPEQMAIAESNFSKDEFLALRQIEAHLQSAAFFACWTRKEAYVKALGAGLSAPLQGFDVSVDPRQAPALRRIASSVAAAREWSLFGAQPADGVWIAAAVKRVTVDWNLYVAGQRFPALRGVRPTHPGA